MSSPESVLIPNTIIKYSHHHSSLFFLLSLAFTSVDSNRMAAFPYPRSTPVILLILLALPFTATAVNVTGILDGHPDFSIFNRLISSTSVAGDLAGRSSLTLLAVPNSFLQRSDLLRSNAIADVVRYHVLLEYLSWRDLDDIPLAGGRLVTTLYQTTGRASGNLGGVNLTRSSSGTVTARSPVPFSSSNATLLSLVMTLPYNVSIFAVDALLVPYGFDLSASDARPQPAGLNITRVLVDGKEFNVAALMLQASGVVEEFEADERGAGITMFVPTDEAFGNLPVTEQLQSLPAERKAVVLRYHVLHSYYPLGSLESIVNPLQPTLATEDVGAGRFTLNITRVNGSVAIDTGIVQATITRTVFDQNPVAVFAVSRVLLPREIFGEEAALLAAPPPVSTGIAPETSAEEPPPTRVSSPARIEGNAIGSGTAPGGRSGGSVCIVLAFLHLLLLIV